jgi:hypothetical protein
MKPIFRFIFLITCGLTLLTGCAHQPPKGKPPRPFNFEKDGFSFANETVWDYQNGKPVVDGKKHDVTKEGEEGYNRRCFVMSRAAVQFWKFARFDSSKPKLSDKELAARVREVTGRDVWRAPLPPSERTVIPGYANLRAASAAKTEVFQKNIGLGWPTYFRPGNTPLVFPPTRAHQARTNDELMESLRLGFPTILWLANFPELDMNHAVIVYAAVKKGAKTVYTVDDPNYSTGPKRLTYDPATRTFSYQKTFYFPGGTVDARPLYLSPMQ